jgi:oxygen-independent coproporphyrinogen III oxidase
MKALEVQLHHEIQRFRVKSKSIESVFIGGGTPSTVEPTYYENIFSIIKPYLKDSIEITSEANPNSATKEWLKGMKQLGVNRISFGVQSFDHEKLKILNRAHSPQNALEAIQNAKNIGYENISLDLIYATLGDTKKLLEHDINTALSLPINHLSAYALTIEEGTPFEKKPHMAKETLKFTSWIFAKLQESGFKQYEISNFGTYQSSHNLGYWQYKDYIGLGSGAVGKLEQERYYPTSNVENYITNPLDIRVETLGEEDVKIEQMFLGFRSIIGVCKDILNADEIKRAQILVEEEKLHFQNDTFYNLDYLLSDEITLFISS